MDGLEAHEMIMRNSTLIAIPEIATNSAQQNPIVTKSLRQRLDITPDPIASAKTIS